MTSQLESKLRIVSSGEEISVITPIISSLVHEGHSIVFQTSKSNLILPNYLIFGMQRHRCRRYSSFDNSSNVWFDSLHL